jgi:segregation and condensation protein A
MVMERAHFLCGNARQRLVETSIVIGVAIAAQLLPTEQATHHVIEIGRFRGSIVALLDAVRAHEMEPMEIPLAEVVKGFLDAIARMDSLDLEQATEFLICAAMLVDLKLRALLPVKTKDEPDEELERFEARDLLLLRRSEAAMFAAAGERLEGLLKSASLAVPRMAGLEEGFISARSDPLSSMTVEDLQRAYLKLMEPKEQERLTTDHLTVDVVTVAETLVALASSLPSMGRVRFRELVPEGGSKEEIVVTFLALLELYKQGRLELEQSEMFGDLWVEWCQHGQVSADELLQEAGLLEKA